MLLRVLALATPLALLTGCTNAIDARPAAVATTPSAWTVYGSPSPEPSPSAEFAPDTVTKGTFRPYRPGATAISYDPEVVPPGAKARLAIADLPYGTSVRLTVEGLLPSRAYGAHLHTKPCTAIPDEAGPHYQHHPDPAAVASPPSVNPVYANPRNEVWLDFTTDATGAGSARSDHGWDFDPAAPPRSLVLHAEHTMTGPGEAGKAGARAACLTLPPG
jgi:superoxide dismutase, Cu-Zn family